MIDRFEHYSDILIYHFDLKRARRSKYSLRAFARDLQTHPSTISRALRRKQDLTLESAVRVAMRLKLEPKHKRNFLELYADEYIRKFLNELKEVSGIEIHR